MQFSEPLVRGRLVRRYQRFLTDVVLDDGRALTAHCPNSGAMTGVDQPGAVVWLSHSAKPGRKYAYTLELVESEGGLVGVNTAHPNAIVAEAVAAGRIPQLAGYRRLRREVPYGQRSRVDLLLEDDALPPFYLEVKNVHLYRPERGAGPDGGRVAEFPDCPTARGARHLEELAAVVRGGARAGLLYLVQRTDCDYFRIAADLDPAYAKAAAAAIEAGVAMLCFACRLSPTAIDFDRPLPILR